MNKLAKSTLPVSHTINDFQCFGPSAIKDGDFSGTKIADLGCFDQSGKDTNKYYHGAITKSKLNEKIYVYFEWGRTGVKPDFQFYECDSESEAGQVYEKQLHSKNDKRGEWYQHPTLGKLLRAKPKKDCYLVRNTAIRNTGLPDSKKITNKIPTVNIAGNNLDKETEQLIRDLRAGNISYTQSNFSSNFIPAIEAINEGRTILAEISKTNVTTEIEELTKLLYSRIPKKTRLGQKVSLEKDDIKLWLEDLDAFEDSYNNINSSSTNLNLAYELKYVDKSNQLWFNVERMLHSSTRNKHSYLPGKMKVLGIWEVINVPDSFKKKQESVTKEYTGIKAPFIFQPELTDLEKKSQTLKLYHGSRSVNIGGIISTKFRLPKNLKGVQINGANIGPGCYHATDWKKSAGYCSIKNGYWSGGSGMINGRESFMFINDVILGNPHFVNRPTHFDSPPKGCHSVIAQGGSFENEEYVVYEESMFYPRYLVEFTV